MYQLQSELAAGVLEEAFLSPTTRELIVNTMEERGVVRTVFPHHTDDGIVFWTSEREGSAGKYRSKTHFEVFCFYEGSIRGNGVSRPPVSEDCILAHHDYNIVVIARIRKWKEEEKTIITARAATATSIRSIRLRFEF
jgi:hypothetical protein